MSLDVQSTPIQHSPIYGEILDGLRQDPPMVASKYLYDKKGSQLFEEICELPEYYLTRTELELTRTCVDDLAAQLGSRPRLIELGSGSGLKTRILLRRLFDVDAYVPVDISPSALRQCTQSVGAEFSDLKITPVCADYTDEFELPQQGFQGRNVLYYPGSTIGNFKPAQARQFLSRLTDLAGPGGHLIIGVDLRKDRSVLEAAYNDSQGVTAAFNRNVLHRINRECEATFVPEKFEHRAIYDEERGRIEMRLISTEDQEVFFPTERLSFERDDFIVTEYSHKFTVEQFIELSEASGWRTRSLWTDRDQYFSLWLLETDQPQ